jgi:hypothetical protein
MASPSITHDRTQRLPTASTIFGKRAVEVIPVAGEQPDALGVPPSEDAEPVVLDFVNPAGPSRRLFRRSGKARF